MICFNNNKLKIGSIVNLTIPSINERSNWSQHNTLYSLCFKMYLVQNLYQIYQLMMTHFCLHFVMEGV